MAASREFRPPLARNNVSSRKYQAAPLAASKSASSPPPGFSTRKWQDRSDTDANSAMPYIFGVMALVSIGYVGFAYYWPVTSPSVASSQTATAVKPAIVFVPPVNGPVNSATTPAAANVAAPIATSP